MIKAIREVLKKKVYFKGFILTTIALFALFAFIPVLIVPGNSLGFQLQTYSTLHYILLGVLAALTGLMFTMKRYTYKMNKKASVSAAGATAVGSSAGLIGVVVGTATCPSCLLAVFGFLGFGTILAVLKYQLYIVGGSILLMLISVNYTAKKVIGKCEKC